MRNFVLVDSAHQFNDYMPCNIQQRIAYGAIGAGGGPYHSPGGASSMYSQLPDSLEQTLAGLPSDAIQFSDLPGRWLAGLLYGETNPFCFAVAEFLKL